MKRKIVSAVLAAACLLFSGCGIPNRVGIWGSTGTRTYAGRQLESILSAIQNQDAQQLQEMFSANAREGAENLDAGIQSLFSLIGTGEVTWENDAFSSSHSNHYGVASEWNHSNFHLTTDHGDYLFRMTTCTREDEEPDNCGLFSIQIEDYEEWYDDMENRYYFPDAGIYLSETAAPSGTAQPPAE